MMECIAYVSQNVQQLQISVLLKIGLLFALHIFHLHPPPVSFSFVKPVRYEAPVLLMNNEAKLKNPAAIYC